MNVFETYNSNWRHKKIKTPLIILVGGYIGTGKSTFSNILKDKLEFINVLPTGVIRSVAQSFTTREKNPELFSHTYKLDTIKFKKSLSREENLLYGYRKQVLLLEQAIIKLIEFANTEGQQYILEGNHISGSLAIAYQTNINIISVFFKCSEVSKYKQLVSGPTHQRELNDYEFENIKTLHNYTVQEIENYAMPTFEYYEHEKALLYVKEQIGNINSSIKP